MSWQNPPELSKMDQILHNVGKLPTNQIIMLTAITTIVQAYKIPDAELEPSVKAEIAEASMMAFQRTVEFTFAGFLLKSLDDPQMKIESVQDCKESLAIAQQMGHAAAIHQLERSKKFVELMAMVNKEQS